MTTTNELTANPPSSLTDIDRLHAMREVAHSLLIKTGIDPDRWCFDLRPGRELMIGLWKYSLIKGYVNWTQAHWVITVVAPSDWQSRRDPREVAHEPAKLTASGSLTPLAIAVITAINDLMWKDRER